MKTELYNIKIEYNSPKNLFLDTATPHYSWEFKTDKLGAYQKNYRIKVYGFINELYWDSGLVESDKSFGILHEGIPLEPDNLYVLKLEVTLGNERLSASVDFRTGLINDTFKKAEWIAADNSCTSPLFRKTVLTEKRPAFATAYIAARGFYELYINGSRVGSRILAPAMLSNATNPYDCAADAYDITSLLQVDNNTFGIWLGTGYKRGSFSKWGWIYEGDEKVCCAFSITYEDGSYELITTDQSWVWHPSPILDNSIYGGETYDKNLEIPNWCNTYLNTSNWQNAKISKDTEGVINKFTRPIEKLQSAKCTRFKVREDEVTFCDFLENGAGFLRIKVTGEPGAKVIITHSENINPDGTLNMYTNRNAKSTDVYVLKGHEIEIYEPRFTYHCFRYAEIRMDGVVQLISAEKITIGSRIESESFFKCDDALLQRMHDNAFRSARSNLISYPSDCAVRDERTPCLMDNMAFEEFAISAFDMHSYYRNWVHNSQYENDPNGKHPIWNGELIVLPHLLNKYYGDREIEPETYKAMKRAISNSVETYKKDGFDGTFGDWCAPKPENPENDYRYCAAYGAEVGLCAGIYQLKLMAKTAAALGKPQDEAEYTSLGEYFRNELYRRFWSESIGAFSEAKQTPNLMALKFGAAKPEDEEKIYNALKNRIKTKDNYHLTTGIAGTRCLISVLSRDDEGMEILSRILHNTDYPSFGQQIMEYDATCLCEQWFGLSGMMSCNHPMFGGIFADYYKIFAGITNAGENFKYIKIAPKLPKSINELHCAYHSVRGKIQVDLRRISGKLNMDVIIPANCFAGVITENGEELKLKSGKYML